MLDLLIRNEYVIDPAGQTDQVGDIAIYNDRITRYEEGEPARHVMDTAGRYVFPGLIDAHAHMFQEGAEVGIYPDMVYLPTRVTSAINFSTGIASYPIFRSTVIARSRIIIKSFLQICPTGLTTISYYECINSGFLNLEKITRMYHDNQGNILGFKIRQSEELAEELGIEPLKGTVRMAGMAGCPVEVHCTNIPVPTSGVLKVLRPKDIFKHVYQEVKNTIVDENDKLYDCVREARRRGIIFDTAEGRKHGDLDIMLRAKGQGFIAGMCSTNLVLGNMFRLPIFSLPNLMFRCTCMGIPISQVVSMVTERPAGLMKVQGEIGYPSKEARADAVIFRWVDFKQTYRDWKGTAFTAGKLLKPEMMVKDGQIMYCAPDYIYEG